MSDIRFNQWLHQSGTGGVSQVASGAVGVGTTNPLADFYVRGDAQITGILTAGHIAMGSSITFGDDDRAYFGDGTDLQIYHNSGNSYIQNSGSGSGLLYIDATQTILRNRVGNEDIAKFVENGPVQLYFNNGEKFTTTNTGAVVTGILTATSFSGDGSNLTGITAPAITSIGSDGAARVLSSDGDGTATAHSEIKIETVSGNKRFSINRGSGSTEVPLLVRRTDASGVIAEFANSGGYGLHIGQNSATGEAYLKTLTGQDMVFTTNSGSGIANERLRITSAGRILIATTTEGHSNADDLTIATAAGSLGNTGITIRSSTTGDGNIFFSDATSGDGETKGVIKYAHNTDHMQFNTAGNERLRITSGGEVTIGTSNPTTFRYVGTGHPHNNNNYTVHGFSNIGLVGRYSSLNMPFDHSTATTSGAWWMLGRSSGNTNEWGLYTRSGNLSNLLSVWKVVGSSNGHIDYQTFSTGANSERLRIFSNGSVGVGDYSSANLTHAFQALRTSGSTYVSSKNTGGNAIFYAEASVGNTAKLELMQAGVGNFTLEVGGTNALMFKDDGTEKLRINSTEINAKVPITGAVPAPNRNLIENGEFLISQRFGDASSTKANSGTNIQNGVENGVIDRWRMGSPSASNFSRQRVTDAPDGFAYSYKITADGSGYSPGSNANYSLFQQIIEATNVARLAFGTSSAKTVTLSFYVKSSYASSTWAVALGNTTGGVYVGNTTRTHIKSYSISSANTWERKTITFPGDTSGTWAKTGTGGGLAVIWDLGSGGSHQGAATSTWVSSDDFRFSGAKNVGDSANGSWQITGIQLEIGDTATEYEHIPIQKEIERCQRYFYCSGLLGSGSWNSSTTFHCAVHHPVAMRGRVTVGDTRSGGLGNINIEPRDQYDITVFDPDAHTHYTPDQVHTNQIMNFTISGSTTGGYSGTVSMDRNNDQFWLSAEL